MSQTESSVLKTYIQGFSVLEELKLKHNVNNSDSKNFWTQKTLRSGLVLTSFSCCDRTKNLCEQILFQRKTFFNEMSVWDASGNEFFQHDKHNMSKQK